MSAVRSFTLIELLIVVILIGIVSFLVVRVPAIMQPPLQIEELRDYLSPDGKLIVFEDGEAVVLKNREKRETDLLISHPVVYKFVENRFEEVHFEPIGNRRVLFSYTVRHGLGDYFILGCDEGYFVFKPLIIQKKRTFEEAKRLFLFSDYQPFPGEYY